MENAASSGKTLPADGLSHCKRIEPFSPFPRGKFRQLIIDGKASQPVKFSERGATYPTREFHEFCADPVNYQAKDSTRSTHVVEKDKPRLNIP